MRSVFMISWTTLVLICSLCCVLGLSLGAGSSWSNTLSTLSVLESSWFTRTWNTSNANSSKPPENQSQTNQFELKLKSQVDLKTWISSHVYLENSYYFIMATTPGSLTSHCSSTLIQQTTVSQSHIITMVTTASLVKTKQPITSYHHRNQPYVSVFQLTIQRPAVCLGLSRFGRLFFVFSRQTFKGEPGQKVHLPSQSWKGTRPPCHPPCPTTSPCGRHPGGG